MTLAVIPLSLSEIAAVARRPRRRGAEVVTARSCSTPARSARARCSSRCPASGSTATTSPRPPRARARSAVLGRRPAGGAAAGAPRRRRPSPTLGAPWPRSPAPPARAGRARPDRGRRHRLGGQDLHEGPARRRCSRRLGPTVAPPGSFNNELGLPLDRAARRRRPPATWCWRWAPAASGHIAAPGRDRAAADRRGAQRRQRPPRRVRPPEAIAQAKGELVEALPARRRRGAQRRRPAGRRAWPRRTTARVVTVRPSRGADVRAEDVTLDDRGRARFRWSPPAGERAGRRCGCTASTRSATRWPRPRSRSSCGMPVEAIAAALSAAAPRIPLADGGHRAAPTA